MESSFSDDNPRPNHILTFNEPSITFVAVFSLKLNLKSQQMVRLPAKVETVCF